MLEPIVALTLVVLWNLCGFIAVRIDDSYEKGAWKDPLVLLLVSGGLFTLAVILMDRQETKRVPS
ncbi:MAG: hypothetical protein JWN38_1268 [Candidatus Saccharibacteria bacterium]|nr:hypothetical protein [Candidatus Saccharibacteria bacterium]